MIPSTAIAEAESLLARGLSRREVARRVGMSRGSVDLVACGKLVPDERAAREQGLAIKNDIEPVKGDIDKVAQALARAIAESRVMRRGIIRCPFCGTGRRDMSVSGSSAQQLMRRHLVSEADCRREMLEEGKVPPDTRRSEPCPSSIGAAGHPKAVTWEHRAGHDSNYASD